MRGVSIVMGGVALVLMLVSAFLGAKHLSAKRGWPLWLVFAGFILIFLGGAGLSVGLRMLRRAPSTPPSAASATNAR